MIEPEVVEVALNIPELIKNVVLGFTSLVTVCSFITAATKTPKRWSSLDKLYKVIEVMALVVKNAKEQDK